MADHLVWPVNSRTREVQELQGIIQIVGNATPANEVISLEALTGGGVKSVKRTATGELTITLAQSYPILLGAFFQSECASDVDANIKLISRDVKTAKTLVIHTRVGTTPTDTPNGRTDFIHFKFSLKNSAVI